MPRNLRAAEATPPPAVALEIVSTDGKGSDRPLRALAVALLAMAREELAGSAPETAGAARAEGGLRAD
jgi:hypothetical protein